jgi:hypothetical protein
LPDDTLQTIFRAALNSHLRDGKSEMHAFIKAWRALSDMGYTPGPGGVWIEKAEEPKVDPPAAPAPPAIDPNAPPPGLTKATGVPRCGTCANFDALGTCRKFNDYPTNAGKVCTAWEAAPMVEKLYVPPVEVQAAAKFAMETGSEAPGIITPTLASGAGLDAGEVRKIAVHFAEKREHDTFLDAYGGPHAAKWAARVIRKLDAPAPVVQNADVDFEISGQICKVDAAQHLVFGWFSVVEIDGIPIEDTQEDIIWPHTIEDSAYDFVLNARKAGEMHEDGNNGEVRGVGRLVESCVFTAEKVKAMIQSLRDQGIEAVIDLHCICWWGGMKIDDPATWAKITTGELRAWSIGGKGKRAAI